MARKRKPKLIQDLEITGMAEKGKGVGRTPDGQVVFVEKVAPGDCVDVLVTRKRSKFMKATPVEYKRLSPHRVEPSCAHFGVCGGCQWQHLAYEEQLKHKEKLVRDAVQRIAKLEVGTFYPILACEQNFYYRNKMEYSFSNARWLTEEELHDQSVSKYEDVLGFHRPGAFNKIVNIDHCWLQPAPSNELRNGIKDLAIEHELPFFDSSQHDGMMRHVIIRTATTGENLILLSFYKNEPEKLHPFMDAVLEKFPQITTLIYCINGKRNDFLGDLPMHTYSGKGYIEEQLGHVRFKIGPKSFFQTNSYQAKKLYDIVADFAGLDGSQNVYDLYTGVGSIALYVAQGSQQVVGIEEIPEAIEDAKENAALNEIENCVFYAGDVKDILTTEFAEKHGKPDLVITDPPRAGMHPEVVEMFLQLKAPKIVYVSCNPSTQARDLNLLSAAYQVDKLQPVDMFPHTHHIESVALLSLKSE